jgi:hypothetical protein
MNALDLHRSSVRFDEQSHTYTTSDGRQLTGVTSIIKQALFPDKYKGIPDAILAKAAERGTAIHNECEDVNLFGEGALNENSSEEARNYHELLASEGITMIYSEYLVTDDEVVATMIDCIDDKGNLYDIKTTSQLDIESLSWQLSFCDYLFTKQNIFLERPSSKLYGIWLRGSTAKLVEVERKSDDDIEEVIQAYLDGEVFTPKPVEFTSPEEEALARISEQEEVIIALKREIDRREAEKQEALDILKARMEEGGLKKLETQNLLLTLVAESESTTFDSKRFKEEHPELAEQYAKKVARKSYVKITLR